jgi:hypothetical protein
MAVGTWEDAVLVRKQAQKHRYLARLIRKRADPIEVAVRETAAVERLQEIKHEMAMHLMHCGMQSVSGL